MKEIKGFDEHVILLCKGHYKCSSLLEGLRMIWVIRCGHEYNSNDTSSYRYIANRLYKILQELQPERMSYLQEIIHDEITCDWKFREYSSIERLISIYCSEICNITIQEKPNNNN